MFGCVLGFDSLGLFVVYFSCVECGLCRPGGCFGGV